MMSEDIQRREKSEEEKKDEENNEVASAPVAEARHKRWQVD